MGEQEEYEKKKMISRREMLKITGAGGVGLLIGASGMGGIMGSTNLLKSHAENVDGSLSNDTIPLYGTHQPGIATPPQNFVYLAAFNLTTEKIKDVRELLKKWTDASESMMKGQLIGEQNQTDFLPPDDTGEVQGISPSKLTVTFGFGPTFFIKDGKDRFGIANKRPKVLKDLPPFSGDELEPEWCGGDICIQACADDLQVAFHAIRNLTRIARGNAVLKWSQSGFQRTHASDPKNATPRNLFGFKDGTVNPSSDELNDVVWAKSGDGQSWMENGTYMVVRRIRMFLEIWDRTTLIDQEQTFGRYRQSGAPLGQEKEFDEVDLQKKGPDGKLAIPKNAHVRLAHGDGSLQILRRGYSYTSEIDIQRGQLDAGLIFISYQRDPVKQFIPIQARLAANDALNEYIVHIGSAVFACPPGIKQGGYIGDTLL